MGGWRPLMAALVGLLPACGSGASAPTSWCCEEGNDFCICNGSSTANSCPANETRTCQGVFYVCCGNRTSGAGSFCECVTPNILSSTNLTCAQWQFQGTASPLTNANDCPSP